MLFVLHNKYCNVNVAEEKIKHRVKKKKKEKMKKRIAKPTR